MFLSVDLHELEQLIEYQDREAMITFRLEESLQQMIQETLCTDLIIRQLDFVKEERRQILGRKALLQKAHETLSKANQKFRENLAEAEHFLKH